MRSVRFQREAKLTFAYLAPPYVPTVPCVDTSISEDSRQWTCVYPPSTNGTIQQPEFLALDCNNASLIAFAGSETLIPSVSLPTSQGGPTSTFKPTNSSVVTSSPSSTPSGPTSLGKDLGIGLGVGIPLGIIALMGVLL
jgi:hypothetical protein